MIVSGYADALETVREALKEATAEHLRHHPLLPEWSSPAHAALDVLAAAVADAEQRLEEKDAELDQACALLLHIEGAILGYWTDMPQNVLEGFRVRIREFLGDWEPSAALQAGALTTPEGDSLEATT